MALTATIMRFFLDLSDVDGGVYETLELQAARHPSESEAYLVTRVLALALEYREKIVFGRGISEPDDPGVFVPNDNGSVDLWIEIGAPSAIRLHKVSKQNDNVRVYTHKQPDAILADLASGAVHRGDSVTVVAFAPEFIGQLAEVLGRKNRWGILRSDGELYVTVGDQTFQTTPQIHQARR